MAARQTKSQFSVGGSVLDTGAGKENLLNRRMLKARVNIPPAIGISKNEKRDAYQDAAARLSDAPNTQEVHA